MLNALLDEINGGSRHWNDVVPLAQEWKSLPSGVLRMWPAGTPLTLATYAAEMISISDNTAADALVRIVGPTALKRYAGNNEPFLTTREMFILKSTEGASSRGMYLTVDSARRPSRSPETHRCAAAARHRANDDHPGALQSSGTTAFEISVSSWNEWPRCR